MNVSTGTACPATGSAKTIIGGPRASAAHTPEDVAGLKALVLQQRRSIMMLKAKLRQHQKQAAIRGSNAPHSHDVDKRGRSISGTHSINDESSPFVREPREGEEEKGNALKRLESASKHTKCHRERATDDESTSAWSFGDCSASTSTFNDGSSLVRELKKKASETDLVLAVQQLEEKTREAEQLEKDLLDSFAENDRLKADLKAKERELGTVQLERDLIAADESRLREEVARLEERSAPLSIASGGEVKRPGGSTARQMKKRTSTAETKPLGPCLSVQKKNENASQSNECVLTSEKTSLSTNQTKVCKPSVRDEPCSRQSLYARNNLNHTPSWDTSQASYSSVSTSRRIETGQITSELSVGTVACNAQQRETSKNCSAPTGDEKCIAGWRDRRRQCQSSNNLESSKGRYFQMSVSSLPPHKGEVNQLQSKLKKSEEIADEYKTEMELSCSTVQTLHGKVASLKEEKLGVELELINHLAMLDHEKRALVKGLQEEIEGKDAKIAALEAKLTRLLGNSSDRIQVGVIEEH